MYYYIFTFEAKIPPQKHNFRCNVAGRSQLNELVFS